jgi:hypothetical protein
MLGNSPGYTGELLRIHVARKIRHDKHFTVRIALLLRLNWFWRGFTDSGLRLATRSVGSSNDSIVNLDN